MHVVSVDVLSGGFLWHSLCGHSLAGRTSVIHMVSVKGIRRLGGVRRCLQWSVHLARFSAGTLTRDTHGECEEIYDVHVVSSISSVECYLARS